MGFSLLALQVFSGLLWSEIMKSKEKMLGSFQPVSSFHNKTDKCMRAKKSGHSSVCLALTIVLL